MIKAWLEKAMITGNQGARGFRSDYDLNPEVRGKINKPYQGRKAAVLVPIVMRDDTAFVLLTKRSDNLPTHAGQVSFPGGKIDDNDKDSVDAALREAEEEIGLNPNKVTIIGELDEYETSTGFHVNPIVGLVDLDHALTPEPGEVAEIFEVPLMFFMNQDNHKQHSREYLGIMRYYYAMPYGDYYIWGATAAMIKNLYDVMMAIPDKDSYHHLIDS